MRMSGHDLVKRRRKMVLFDELFSEIGRKEAFVVVRRSCETPETNIGKNDKTGLKQRQSNQSSVYDEITQTGEKKITVMS